ncbi:MAG: Gfo/Idh/MocA family oxidoreductase [Gemmatimonadaceae bacterium]|nr:Gfo/Idh/MocA family oxidoreductase [Gemmatimonadaceae bacterium]
MNCCSSAAAALTPAAKGPFRASRLTHRYTASTAHPDPHVSADQKRSDRLNIGVLGCGPIAQAAHFESCTKARNATLYAICDVADDLLARMAITHGATKAYTTYDEMLSDPVVDAVIIATSDEFHVPAAMQAVRAGKHVLCEKPVGVSIEEVDMLRTEAMTHDRQVMVGHMKRFDPGLQAARHFVRREMGDMLAFKGWYCDSTHRYAVTDAVQPRLVRSTSARKPVRDPRVDLPRYYMLAHGSHLVDTARFLCGEIVSVHATRTQRYGAYCWFIATEFANGAIGHLELTVSVRMDWHEGVQIHGEHGSVLAKTYNPWLFKSSDVEIFHEATATYTRPLGADAHFYRRQVEAFAEALLTGQDVTTTGAAGIDDGIAAVRTMVAIVRSVESGERVRVAAATGAV